MKKILLNRFLIGFIIITNIFSLIIWREEKQTTLKASGLDSLSSGTTTVYEWKQVWDKSDLPTTRDKEYFMWLVWSTDAGYHGGNQQACSNNFWYLSGNSHSSYRMDGTKYASSSDDFKNQFPISEKSFLTTSTYQLPSIWYVGDDSGRPDNKGAAHTYKIKLYKGDYWKKHISGACCYDEGLAFSGSSYDAWQICVGPSGGKKNYTLSAKYSGNCTLAANIGGAHRDAGLMWKSGNSYIWGEQENGWDDYDSFIVYIGTPKEYSKIISNLTVASGNVLNLDGEVIIPEGVTITVEPGAVLSIESNIFLHGKIENYGTVIVQPNSIMQPINNASKGTINSYGSYEKVKLNATGATVSAEGNLIVMNDATLIMSSNGSLNFSKGASLCNMGTIVNPGATLIKDEALCLNNGQYVVGLKIMSVATNTVIAYDEKKKICASADSKTSLKSVSLDSITYVSSSAKIVGNKMIDAKTGKTLY